eukprot:50795_1
MCASFILGSLVISLKIFNVLHVLVGIAITSFGCYLQIEYGTYVVSIVSLSVGSFITLLGCLGICAAVKQKWCLLTTYSVLMGVLFFVNAAILLVSFFKYDALLGSVDSDNVNINKAKDELENRKHLFQIVLGSVVFVEFICIWFSLMMRRHEGAILDEGYKEFDVDHSSHDLTLGSHHESEDQILSASQKNREAIREKYGLQLNRE